MARKMMRASRDAPMWTAELAIAACIIVLAMLIRTA
jgi:hypothetical protein